MRNLPARILGILTAISLAAVGGPAPAPDRPAGPPGVPPGRRTHPAG